MNSSQFLSIATFVFGLAALLYMAALIFKKNKLAVPARWTVVAAVGMTTAGLLLRWVESYRLGFGHAPLSNLYESLVFFSWTAGIIYLFMEFKHKNALVGAFVTPIVFLAMAYASMSPNISDRIQPLIPA
jgi:ABC-type transport system involved in cytochrome c biogenesis permease subunit